MVELQKKNKCLIYLRQHEKQTEFTLKKTEQTKDFYYTKVFEKAQIKLQYILLWCDPYIIRSIFCDQYAIKLNLSATRTVMMASTQQTVAEQLHLLCIVILVFEKGATWWAKCEFLSSSSFCRIQF